MSDKIPRIRADRHRPKLRRLRTEGFADDSPGPSAHSTSWKTSVKVKQTHQETAGYFDDGKCQIIPATYLSQLLLYDCQTSAAGPTPATSVSDFRGRPGLTEQPVCFQKEGREEEDIIPTPKPKGRKSDPEAKKKTPKKMPEDALKKRLNILYKTAFEYTVSRHDNSNRLLWRPVP